MTFSRRPCNTLFLQLAAALSGVLLLAAPALAQIHKCVDKDGKTNYSQSPCPANSKSSTLRQIVPPASAGSGAGSAAPLSAAEKEADFQKRRQAEAEAAKKDSAKAQEAAQKDENCKSAKSTLASLQAGGRQSRMGDNGQRYFLTDGDIAQETDKARQAVSSWCAG